MITRMSWIPAEGTFQVNGADDAFNPTIGKLTFHPMTAQDVVAATSEDDSDRHPLTMVPGQQAPPRPQLITEEVPDAHQWAKRSSSLTLLLNCAALCNLASVFEEREDPGEGDEEKAGNLTGKYAATGDPTEIAIQVFAHRFQWGKPTLTTGNSRWSELHEYPFDSTLKRMAVIMESPSGKERKVFMKGAVEMVLSSCSSILVKRPDASEDGTDDVKSEELGASWKEKILANVDAMASKGLRCLALATKDWHDDDVLDDDYEEVKEGDAEEGEDNQPPRKAVERGLMFLGLVGYVPPFEFLPRLRLIFVVSTIHHVMNLLPRWLNSKRLPFVLTCLPATTLGRLLRS